MRTRHNRLDPDCPTRVLNPKVGAELSRALGDTFRLVTLSSEVSIEHRFPDARPQFAFVASLDFVDEMWRPDIGFDVLGQQLAEVSRCDLVVRKPVLERSNNSRMVMGEALMAIPA